MQAAPTRKLMLAKETLRPLGDQALRQSQGGVTITLSLVLSCATIDCSGGGEASTGSFSCGKVGVCCVEADR